MDKKTLAYILIGAGVLAAAYYLYTKSKSAASAAALGAGTVDNRGVWAADDDNMYNTMRNRVLNFNNDKINGHDALGWIDPLVKQNYESGPGFHNLQGKASKSGAFLSVMEAVNYNVSGKYTGNQSGGRTQLFPDDITTALWHDFNNLEVKYGGL